MYDVIFSGDTKMFFGTNVVKIFDEALTILEPLLSARLYLAAIFMNEDKNKLPLFNQSIPFLANTEYKSSASSRRYLNSRSV